MRVGRAFRKRLPVLVSVVAVLTTGAPVAGQSSEKEADPAVAPADGDVRDDRVACADCSGTGVTTCGHCRGEKQVRGPCDSCVKGRQICAASGCVDGRVKCRVCRGRGQRAAYNGRRLTGYVACGECNGRGTRDCEKCFRGKVRCRKCRGRERVMRACAECQGAGNLLCPSCAGEGTVEVVVERSDFASRRPDEGSFYKKYQRETLAQALAQIRKCNADLRELGEEFKALTARIPDAGKEYHELSQREIWTAAQRRRLTNVEQAWKPCLEQVDEHTEAYNALLGREESSRHELGKIVQLQAAIAEPGADPVEPAKLTEVRKFAQGYRSDVEIFRVRLGRLSSSLEHARSTFDEFDEQWQRDQEEQRQEEEERQTVGEQFDAFRRKLSDVSLEISLPEIACELIDSSSRPNSLAVEIRYVDREARPSERREKILPTEAYLEEVPDLITRAFAASPHLNKVTIAVKGTILTKTGHERSGTIQEFNVRRGFWLQLVTGRFRSDWKKLLQKAHPVPAYPRLTLTSSDVPWLFTLLVVVLGFAIALAIVARMRVA